MREFLEKLISTWWGITTIVIAALAIWVLLSVLLYRPFFKRFYDVALSGVALLALSPILLILIILGEIKMKGNPFFTQSRPGKKEKVFKLLKFRTMTNERDENGVLLPDEKRLTRYGKFLRSTSLDELPELINIFIGDMSIVGPRPLLVQYLPLYNEEQKHRHDIRPGLTGYAQVNGRNTISWEEKFKLDVEYAKNISLFGDVVIIFKTVLSVFKREGISSETSATMEEFKGTREKCLKDSEKSMKEFKILFTSVGRRVELIESFKSAAKRLAIGVEIWGADITETAPALFFCDKKVQVCPIKNNDYIPQLLEVCKREKIIAVIPTIDTDLLLLSRNIQKFSEIGTKVFISHEDKITICRDKRLTAQYFHSLGLSSPIATDNYLLYDGGFPAFIKPKDGSSSIFAYKVENEEELASYAKQVPGYIIQPFIEGKEYTIDIFCNLQGKPIYITPRERLAVRAGEVLKTKICNDEIMIEEMHHLLEDFKPRGAITVQLIKQKGSNKNFYIEINPRFGGGAPLSMKAGADSAEALLKLLCGKKVEYFHNAAEDGAIYCRFDQSIRVNK